MTVTIKVDAQLTYRISKKHFDIAYSEFYKDNKSDYVEDEDSDELMQAFLTELMQDDGIDDLTFISDFIVEGVQQ